KRRAADRHPLGLGRERQQRRTRRLRGERERRRHHRALLLVEDDDLLFAQWVPGGGRVRRARERRLVDLRVAPDEQVGATIEPAALDVADREVGRQRLAVVHRRPAVVATVEGVLPGDRGLWVGRRSL